MLMNIIPKKNQCISSWSLNTHHTKTNCNDSFLKNRMRAEFSFLMLALLVERNNQKKDLHCINILKLKSRNRCLVSLSSCTVVWLSFSGFWQSYPQPCQCKWKRKGKLGALVRLFDRKATVFAALSCAFYNSFCQNMKEWNSSVLTRY